MTLVHIAICNSVKHAPRNRILFSFPPGLVWPVPYPLVPWSACYREGVTGRERGLVTYSQCVRELEREGSLVFFLHGWTSRVGQSSFWKSLVDNDYVQLLSDVT